MVSKFRIFKQNADVWPVTAITLGLALSLLPFFVDFRFVFPLCLIGIALRILVPIHQHYHSHLSTFRSQWANSVYDIILSLSGGNLTALWKVHHGLGHHVEYLDQEKDLEGNLRFGKKIKARRLVFTILGDTLSLYDSVNFLKKFSKAVRKQHHSQILGQLGIQVVLFTLLLLINWKLSLLVFGIPNLFLRWAVFWFSYGQHDDLPMTNVFDSSTTRFRLNLILLNVGLHTAHHDKPGLHWSKLPARTLEILPLIDPVCLNKKLSEAF